MSSSYGIGSIGKKKKISTKSQAEIDSFLKGIDDNTSGPYELDKLYKEKGNKRDKFQRVHKKDVKISKKKKKKSSKKKSDYQLFVSSKLKEYKKLFPNMSQTDKFKKIGQEWKKVKNKSV